MNRDRSVRKSLVLRRSSVRVLTAQEMARVDGGITKTATDTADSQALAKQACNPTASNASPLCVNPGGMVDP